MTMTPESFRQHFDDATQGQPLGSSMHDDLHRGRRRLRGRRRAATIVATAVLAAAGLGGAAALGHGTSTGAGRGHDAAVAPSTDAQLLESCRHGDQGSRPTALVFGSGTPTIERAVRTDYQWEVALQSADGRYWADCFVHLQSAEFAAGMTVYDATQTSSTGTEYGIGPGCGLVGGELDPTCRTWSVYTVDRLPPAVAAVEYEFGDGTSQTVDSENGYVVLNRLGPLPAGVSYATASGISGEQGRNAPMLEISRITYLDAAGRPLATGNVGARRGDRSGAGALPPLESYPSLRGDALS